MNHTATTDTDHDWREAGRAWGHAAVEWACLYEHYAIDVLLAVFQRTGIGPGTEVLDVACGAGLAIRVARGCDATASGIEASEALLDIARERNPGADIRLGSMFELPWPDDSFDVVVSFNGIWGHCADALVEMRRVIRPGGLVGITFWGFGPPLDGRPFFEAVAAHTPSTTIDGMRATNAIAKPGVAESMLEDAGFTIVERGARVSTIEWPDAETAWRALSSGGPIVPALEHSGVEAVRRDTLAALETCRDRFGIYRYRNDHQFVIARAV